MKQAQRVSAEAVVDRPVDPMVVAEDLVGYPMLELGLVLGGVGFCGTLLLQAFELCRSCVRQI